MLNLIRCSCHDIPSDIDYLIRKDKGSKHLIDNLIRKLREKKIELPAQVQLEAKLVTYVSQNIVCL